MLISKKTPHEMLKNIQHAKASSRQKDGVRLNNDKPGNLLRRYEKMLDAGETDVKMLEWMVSGQE